MADISLAPIVLFVYNRPDHTKRALDSLKKNILADKSELYIYADGPKNPNDKSNITLIGEVRKLISDLEGFKKIHLAERDKNWGLAENIIDGVTSIVNRHGKIIVLEDDLELSPWFLSFMNAALTRYSNDDRLMHVSSYTLPVKINSGSYFLEGVSSTWGWGTWDRAWSFFEADSGILLNSIKERGLIEKFNFSNSCDYYAMLQDQADGRVNSWGIRWYASVFLKRGFGFFPAQSYVQNIGHDDSGVHCHHSDDYTHQQLSESLPSFDHDEVINDHAVREEISRFYRKMNRKTLRDYLENFKDIVGYYPIRRGINSMFNVGR